MLRARKAKKGLSGAVTALILVIASVIIALVVVGFAFGLFGAYGGTPTVTQIGQAYMTYNPSTKTYTVSVVLSSSGKAKIVTASFNNQPGLTPQGLPITLTAGDNTITITFAGTATLQTGSTYTISLGLSDGATVTVSVIYEGST